MPGTVKGPVAVCPRETIEATIRQIKWQTGWPINIPATTDAVIKLAQERGMLKLIEAEGCKTA